MKAWQQILNQLQCNGPVFWTIRAAKLCSGTGPLIIERVRAMKTQNARRLLKALWIRACRYDSIDPSAKFVIFSDENPHMRRYNIIALLVSKADNLRIMSNDGFYKQL